VDRLSDKTVRIRWPRSISNGTVTIFAGRSPEAIDRSRPLAVAVNSPVTLMASPAFPEIADDRRAYYELVPASGTASIITAERRLPLEGPDNFRDLGGYATADGRTVRWGRLYRSNELSSLTRRDLDYLSGLDVKLLCDFRSDREREQKPNRALASESPETLDLPVEQEGMDPSALQEKIRTGGIAALWSEKKMHSAYRAFVTEHSARWAALFRRIARPENLPALVHCTGGKDRTGFASALVLLALGVPEEMVFEDYLLTNRYREDFSRFVLRWVPLYSLFRTEPEDLLPLLEARREYLRTSLDTIEELHGSLDAYLENELGVTPEIRTALAANLLR
jgi:protein-tyrosine phosphatase